jgi:hypothetical protein
LGKRERRKERKKLRTPQKEGGVSFPLFSLSPLFLSSSSLAPFGHETYYLTPTSAFVLQQQQQQQQKIVTIRSRPDKAPICGSGPAAAAVGDSSNACQSLDGAKKHILF